MNRGYITGNGSGAKLDSCMAIMTDLHTRAQNIANTRKMYCPDWSVTYGLRTAEEQFELFKLGRTYHEESHEWFIYDKSKVVTYCDGYEKLSVHQTGYAIDICAYIDGKANFDIENLALIATCYFEAASDMGIDIDWGGSFKSISDACHIEIAEKDRE